MKRDLFAIAALVGALVAETGAASTLRVATDAPKQSRWGKLYATWAKAVAKKTGGVVTVDFSWNGIAGPSSGALAKIQAGALDGAGVTTSVLSSVDSDVLALELPSVGATWSELDSARAAVQSQLETVLDARGFSFGWWEDIGTVRLYTSGFTANRPRFLSGKMLRTSFDGPIFATLVKALGAARPPASSPVRSNAAFSTANGSPGSLFDHVDAEPDFCAGGAMVFGKRALAQLPPGVAVVVTDLGARAQNIAASSGRRQDAATFANLASGMAVVTRSPAETSEWNRVFLGVIQRLAHGTIDKAVVNQVLAIRHDPPVP